MGVPVVRVPAIRDNDDLYQREARNAIKQLDSPGLRKVTVTGITLGASSTLVAHQLGKIPVGWLVIDKNAQADIWRDAASTADTISLRASAGVVVDLQFW